MQQQRRPPRSATEAKAPRREIDLNKERLIYCLTSLIGHKVAAKLRGNVVYEGVLHGCALEGDYSITLKYARSLASEHAKSGPVIETLVIPGKDFLQVDAVDVPRPQLIDDGIEAAEGAAFATDAEISGKRAAPTGEDRDLVPWAGGGEVAEVGGLQDGHDSNWSVSEMFKVNEQQYGITSTFKLDLYTTKLDPSSIPREKREEAERIAKEIENGTNHTDMEDRVGDDDNDEEGRFSAVAGTGAYARPGASSGASPSAKSRGTAAAARPVSEAALAEIAKAGQPGDALAGQSGDAARDYRRQRGMIVAHSPMHSSMISEMKRINALNLEPAVPKLDDKTGNDWINFKQSQSRNKTTPSQGDGLKKEFEHALSVIQRRTDGKKQPDGRQDQLAQAGQSDASGSNRAKASPSGGGSKPFAFNPNAKDFTFNPTAASFTPTSAGAGSAAATPTAAQQSAPSAVAKPSGPAFNSNPANPEFLKLSLEDILDGFVRFSSNDASGAVKEDVSWGDSKGPSFHEILGQPNPSLPHGQNNMGGGGSMPGQWQQPGMGQMPAPGQPGQPGQPAAPQMMVQQGHPGAAGGTQPGQPGAPQMMGQQGFMMGQAPAGQPPQMFQPMYPAPGSAPMRPPGGGGQMPQQGQQQGQQQQQQQQQMVFNQQGQQMAMPGNMQGQQMAMPANMIQAQGGQTQGGVNMTNVPKFGMPGVPQGMVMLMPTGQGGMPQAMMMPVQGQPGQHPGQPGQSGPQGNPAGAPQMMQRPMYHGQMSGGQMGGGVPPQHQGHDG